MTKNKLTRNDKQGIIVLAVLAIIIFLLVIMIHNSAKCNKTTYEYAVNGNIYKSNKCYQKDNGDTYCMKGSEIIAVDSYYPEE